MKRDAMSNRADRLTNSEGPWKEMVGIPIELAQELIEKDTNGSVQVLVVPEESSIGYTMDHRLDRVRILAGANGRVAQIPRKG